MCVVGVCVCMCVDYMLLRVCVFVYFAHCFILRMSVLIIFSRFSEFFVSFV